MLVSKTYPFWELNNPVICRSMGDIKAYDYCHIQWCTVQGENNIYSGDNISKKSNDQAISTEIHRIWFTLKLW